MQDKRPGRRLKPLDPKTSHAARLGAEIRAQTRGAFGDGRARAWVDRSSRTDRAVAAIRQALMSHDVCLG
jgi:hypothetical protein